MQIAFLQAAGFGPLPTEAGNKKTAMNTRKSSKHNLGKQIFTTKPVFGSAAKLNKGKKKKGSAANKKSPFSLGRKGEYFRSGGKTITDDKRKKKHFPEKRQKHKIAVKKPPEGQERKDRRGRAPAENGRNRPGQTDPSTSGKHHFARHFGEWITGDRPKKKQGTTGQIRKTRKRTGGESRWSR